MLISSREAAQILSAAGLTRERARRVLLAGFAGEGLRTRGSLLYEEERVRALLEWPVMDPRVVRDTCMQGVFVARLREPDPQLRHWQLSAWVRLEMRQVIEAQGFLPLVATVCGFVAAGANITAVWPGRSGSGAGSGQGSTLDLDEPGGWFEPFRNRRLVTGPGSAWLLWRPRPRPPALHPETLQGETL